MLKKQAVSYTEHVVQRGPYHLSAREYPGEDPPMLLIHGFPDNMHHYVQIDEPEHVAHLLLSTPLADQA